MSIIWAIQSKLLQKPFKMVLIADIFKIIQTFVLGT